MVKNLILKNTLREESISALIQELNDRVQTGELSGLSAAVHFDTFFRNRFNL
jgi:hypothetical protein